MGEVKWIKITTDIFDDEKILLIESLPEADSIIVIWFKLLCLAGKTNNSGVLMINDKLAYTDKMLATIFRRKESTVKLALQTFEDFGMIERVEGVITIPNWSKHQKFDQLEKKKEYQRVYMQEYREKQKKIACKTNCKTNSETNVSCSDKEEDKEKEEEREEIHTSKIEHKSLVKQSKKDFADKFLKMYNENCPSFPKVRNLSDKRVSMINNLFKKYDEATILECLKKCEASDFLAGYTSDWRANIDWIIKDSNFIKILEGNYDNHKAKKSKAMSVEARTGIKMAKNKYKTV